MPFRTAMWCLMLIIQLLFNNLLFLSLALLASWRFYDRQKNSSACQQKTPAYVIQSRQANPNI